MYCLSTAISYVNCFNYVGAMKTVSAYKLYDEMFYLEIARTKY